jgi:hypothetical protein
VLRWGICRCGEGMRKEMLEKSESHGESAVRRVVRTAIFISLIFLQTIPPSKMLGVFRDCKVNSRRSTLCCRPSQCTWSSGTLKPSLRVNFFAYYSLYQTFWNIEIVLVPLRAEVESSSLTHLHSKSIYQKSSNI